jgi:hypothetical protein
MAEEALTFENGVYEGQEPSLLPVGFAAKLENWVAEPNGSLRCRAGWNRASLTGLPATRRGKGMGVLKLNYHRATPTRVQDVKNHGSSATASATWDTATTEGNLLVLVVTNRDGNAVTTPAGWTLAEERRVAASQTIYVFYKQGAASESGAVNATLSGSVPWQAYLLEYAHIAPTGALDVTVDATGTSTTPSTGTTATTTQAQELWLGILNQGSGAVHTLPTNGFTIVDQSQESGHSTAVLEKTVTATGTASTSTTTSSGSAWVGVMVTFKAGLAEPASYLLVAHDNLAGFTIYYTDSDLSESFSTLETIAGTTFALPVKFAQGLGGVIYTNLEFAAPRRWDGQLAPAAVTGAPAGRAIAFHLDRFWIGGALEYASRLYFSKVGDYTDWTTGGGADDAGYIDIGLEDGDAIESLEVFEDGILVAKTTSLWFLSGSTTADFAVHRLNGGGASPGASTCGTPFGCVIADANKVWLWTGGGVEAISDAIESSYEITGYASVSYIDGHAYICDSGTGTVYAIDLQTGTWQMETVDDADEAPATLFAFGDKLHYAPRAATENSLIQYRSHPKEVRQRDPGEQTFTLWTPEYRFGGVSQVVTPKRLKIAVRQRGEGDMPMVITPYYNGEAETDVVEVTPQATAGTFVERLGVGSRRGVDTVQFRITHTVTDDCLMDIEAMSLEYELIDR